MTTFITKDATDPFSSEIDGDSVVVRRGVLVAVVGLEYPIDLIGSDQTAIIQGDVVGGSIGVRLGNLGSDHNEKVTIFADATVSALMSGLGSVSVLASTSNIQNAGEVWGDYAGVYLNTADAVIGQSVIGNTGSVIGGSYGLYVLGSQEIGITNSGTIHGDIASFIDFSGGAGQTITNRGLMEGDVLLGGGDDSYNGARGSLTGLVFGDDGNDRIKTGADDDQIDGGSGKDRLTGGLGEDTFYFDTAPIGAANADTITDFDPENDVIALAHSLFGLSEGKFPMASFLASKNGHAADADDHFLYNTTNGNLSYDADGKGGDKAELLATFLHHPGITAADFIIT